MSEFEASGHLKAVKPELPPPLRSREERLNYLIRCVEACLSARVACDMPACLPNESEAAAQRRLYKVFLMRHGSALGALGFALRTEMIDTEAYAQLTNEIRGTLLPTMPGGLT